MLEHEVGGAVQCNGRLAGSRTALNDEHLVDRRPDHDVLLGLDRGHDLAHRASPCRADLGEHGVGDAARRVGRIGIIEVLVEVGRDLAGPAFGGVHREPAAKGNAERVSAGGPVERRRHGCPPIDDHRVVLIILDVATSDVPRVEAPFDTRSRGL